MEKRYIGDAVYVEIEDGILKLTTTDGTRDTNTIYMEQDVFQSLVIYQRDAVEHYAKLRAEAEKVQ